MSYRFVDHTAELQLEIAAPTRAAVFADAVLALGEVLGADASSERRSRSRALVVSAGDDPTLLAAWIDELVFVAETESLVPGRVESMELDQGRVVAVVSFIEAEPRHIVKGATYHELRLAPEGAGWAGRVVLDV